MCRDHRGITGKTFRIASVKRGIAFLPKIVLMPFPADIPALIKNCVILKFFAMRNATLF
jgi:hypothetical protein